jgi:hypothetical protein
MITKKNAITKEAILRKADITINMLFLGALVWLVISMVLLGVFLFAILP